MTSRFESIESIESIEKKISENDSEMTELKFELGKLEFIRDRLEELLAEKIRIEKKRISPLAAKVLNHLWQNFFPPESGLWTFDDNGVEYRGKEDPKINLDKILFDLTVRIGVRSGDAHRVISSLKIRKLSIWRNDYEARIDDFRALQTLVGIPIWGEG